MSDKQIQGKLDCNNIYMVEGVKDMSFLDIWRI